MRFKALSVFVVGSIALVGVAACSSSSATPQPSPATTSVAPTTPKSEIANPLNLSKFAADVCAGWTDAQITPYLVAIDSRDPGTGSSGPNCTIHPQDLEKPFLGLAVENVSTPTQAALYASEANFPWRKNIPAIAGYPAVDASPAASGQGSCITDAAVNATQNLHVQFTVTNPSDANYAKPCVASEALMADLIQNVQAGGS